ncbi:glycylpeptide N-tetradecanoyltransferase [Homalodisca vitripennis]|nr:glycylpeptide N-tetradecanoyltransferase [Homalodisca vitripennis]
MASCSRTLREIYLVISNDCDDSSECSDVSEPCEVVGGIEDVVRSDHSGRGSDGESDNDLHQVTAQQTTRRPAVRVPPPWCRTINFIEPIYIEASRILTERDRQSKLIEVRSTVIAWKQCERERYLSRFDLVPLFSEEEFRHWFLPQPGIVDSYIVENDGNVTDMVSFYTLPSTVMHHPVHRTLKAAYSFYNVSMKTPWVDLMQDALISAKNAGFDVFNALDLMENKEFLETLKFGIGDGNLQYYLYNWRCPPVAPNKIGLVLQ